jgi:hypothetical protein
MIVQRPAVAGAAGDTGYQQAAQASAMLSNPLRTAPPEVDSARRTSDSLSLNVTECARTGYVPPLRRP